MEFTPNLDFNFDDIWYPKGNGPAYNPTTYTSSFANNATGNTSSPSNPSPSPNSGFMEFDWENPTPDQSWNTNNGKTYGGFAGTTPTEPDTSFSTNATATPASTYTAPATTYTAPTTATSTAATATTSTAAPASISGTKFSDYITNQPDLQTLWTAPVGQKGMFEGLSMEDAGAKHWTNYGQYEGRTNPNLTPNTPTPNERAGQLVDQIKNLYTTTQGYGNDASLNDIKIRQVERDNLMAELDKLGLANQTNLGKTYGGFIDDKYASVDAAKKQATTWFEDFDARFGGDSWAKAKNAPLVTDFQTILDQIDAADDDIDKYAYDPAMQKQAIAIRDKLVASLQARQGQKTLEQNRISTFETGLNSRLDVLLADLDKMDAAGFDKSSAQYKTQMREIENELRGFKGELPFDLNDEVAKLSSANSRWGEVRAQRDQEVVRVANAMAAFGAEGEALADALSALDGYNGAGMAQIENRYQRLKAKSAGNSNPQLDRLFAEIETGLTNLKTMQKKLLDRERAGAQSLNDRLSGLADYDEDGMNALDQMISGQRQGLTRFTGNSTDDILDLLRSASTGLGDRRLGLTRKRGSIEDELAGLIDAETGTRYASLDDVKTRRGQISLKASDVRKYRASQAQDELDTLMQMLSGEENRINTDLSASAARDKAQATKTSSQLNRWGNIVSDGGVTYDGRSDAEILALARKRQVDRRLTPYAPQSAFSQLVGA